MTNKIPEYDTDNDGVIEANIDNESINNAEYVDSESRLSGLAGTLSSPTKVILTADFTTTSTVDFDTCPFLYLDLNGHQITGDVGGSFSQIVRYTVDAGEVVVCNGTLRPINSAGDGLGIGDGSSNSFPAYARVENVTFENYANHGIIGSTADPASAAPAHTRGDMELVSCEFTPPSGGSSNESVTVNNARRVTMRNCWFPSNNKPWAVVSRFIEIENCGYETDAFGPAMHGQDVYVRDVYGDVVSTSSWFDLRPYVTIEQGSQFASADLIDVRGLTLKGTAHRVKLEPYDDTTVVKNAVIDAYQQQCPVRLESGADTQATVDNLELSLRYDTTPTGSPYIIEAAEVSVGSGHLMTADGELPTAVVRANIANGNRTVNMREIGPLPGDATYIVELNDSGNGNTLNGEIDQGGRNQYATAYSNVVSGTDGTVGVNST